MMQSRIAAWAGACLLTVALASCGPSGEKPAKPAPGASATAPAANQAGTKPAAPAPQAAPVPAPQPPPAPAKPPEAQKPQGYLDLTLRQPKRVEKNMDVVTVKQAVQAYQAMNGKLPASLDDLKKDGMTLPKPPDGYAYKYDPKTGNVEIVTGPERR